MTITTRFLLAIQAFRELGAGQIGLYAFYRLGLASGHYYRQSVSQQRKIKLETAKCKPGQIINLPGADELRRSLGVDGVQRALAQADDIAAGKVRLFGGEPQELRLFANGPLAHWTAYERRNVQPPFDQPGEREADVKFTWEPARFDWVYTLGRAYWLSGDELYPVAFWRFAETFLESNPPEYGPHWISAQEVALRLVAFVFALQIFGGSAQTSPGRIELLATAIAAHAARIPPTLIYARAQNNNHLLSEAVGLYTAGLCLPDHTQAARWRELGWHWFNRGIQTQIEADGAYCQSSTNYHRLMLQLAIWFNSLADRQGQGLPEATRQRLAAATLWLLALVEPTNGHVPNLGPNDGADIQPLDGCPFDDYRPVLQAATQVFIGRRPFDLGEWDELTLWLGNCGIQSDGSVSQLSLENGEPDIPHILRNPDGVSWAYLRAAQFHSRPGHADQLHLDLWRHGYNLAIDPGTFLYNAKPPWDNALTHSMVHNTLTINNQEQMRRAGRFLYLDWAQAKILDGERNPDGSWRSLCAEHNGYRRFGLLHQRRVIAQEAGDWLIEDAIALKGAGRIPPPAPVIVRLHWLLPDWPWRLTGRLLRLESTIVSTEILLEIGEGVEPNSVQIGLVRAGEWLVGQGDIQPFWGWRSPTYGLKLPALSLFLSARLSPPGKLTTRWHFPVE